jgi:hypothetical protein
MLSLVDCIAFSGLTPEQLEVVAHFKRIPTVVAAEWAESVLDCDGGCAEIEQALEEEIALARRNHRTCAETWRIALAQFRTTHGGRA